VYDQVRGTMDSAQPLKTGTYGGGARLEGFKQVLLVRSYIPPVQRVQHPQGIQCPIVHVRVALHRGDGHHFGAPAARQSHPLRPQHHGQAPGVVGAYVTVVDHQAILVLHG